MKKKLIIAVSLAILIAPAMQAQFNYYASPADLEKYQFYRQRFWNKFLDPDAFGLVDLTMSDKTQNPEKWCVPMELKNGHWGADLGYRERGEAGIRLGWYMAVLATEFKLLKLSGQATDDVKRELYYAMRMYESMDKRAEYFMLFRDGPLPANAPLNGIFTRVTYFNGPEPWDEHFNDTDLANRTQTYYNSADQMSGLLLGFSLVKKYMSGEKYVGVDDASTSGFDFGNAAATYVDALGDWLDRNDFTGRISNANGTQRFEPQGDIGRDDIAAIMRGNFKRIFDVTEDDPFSNFRYRAVTGEGTGYLLGAAMEKITGVNYFDNKDDCHPEMVTSALVLTGLGQFGTAYATCDGQQRYQMRIETERIHDLRLLFGSIPVYQAWDTYWKNRRSFGIGYKMTDIAVGNQFKQFGWENVASRYNIDMYIMLADLLHSDYTPSSSVRSNQKKKDYYLLKCANPLGAMCRPEDYPTEYTRYWISRRFARPLPGVMDDNGHDVSAEGEGQHFAGLDFMLLHNLYLLDQYDNIHDHLDLSGRGDRNGVIFNREAYESKELGSVDAKIYNERIGDEGSDGRGVYADEVAKEDIHSIEHIEAKDKRRYYAPLIKLNQGFHAKAGAHFKAKASDLKYRVNNTFVSQIPDASENNTAGYLDMSVAHLKKTEQYEGVEWNSNTEVMQIYPNPTAGDLILNLPNEIQEVRIYNSLGQLVMEEELDGTSKTWYEDLSALNNGIYLIEVNDGTQIHQSKIQLDK